MVVTRLGLTGGAHSVLFELHRFAVTVKVVCKSGRWIVAVEDSKRSNVPHRCFVSCTDQLFKFVFYEGRNQACRRAWCKTPIMAVLVFLTPFVLFVLWLYFGNERR